VHHSLHRCAPSIPPVTSTDFAENLSNSTGHATTVVEAKQLIGLARTAQRRGDVKILLGFFQP
jgi:hypothetical protein